MNHVLELLLFSKTNQWIIGIHCLELDKEIKIPKPDENSTQTLGPKGESLIRNLFVNTTTK